MLRVIPSVSNEVGAHVLSCHLLRVGVGAVERSIGPLLHDLAVKTFVALEDLSVSRCLELKHLVDLLDIIRLLPTGDLAFGVVLDHSGEFVLAFRPINLHTMSIDEDGGEDARGLHRVRIDRFGVVLDVEVFDVLEDITHDCEHLAEADAFLVSLSRPQFEVELGRKIRGELLLESGELFSIEDSHRGGFLEVTHLHAELVVRGVHG